MRILIGGALLIFGAAAAILVTLASAGPRVSDRISVTVNEQARRVDISIDAR